jgi:UDP-glucose 4-epimerase
MVRWLMSILVNSSTKCPIYNVGSDEVISLHALAKIIGKIFKKPVEIRKINRKKIEKYVPSIKKAQKELNLKINYKLKPSLYSIIKQRYKQRN